MMTNYLFKKIYETDNGKEYGTWELSQQELAFGDYTPGRYGWMLANPILFEKPTPAKGQQGLWSFDKSLLLSVAVGEENNFRKIIK